MKCFSRALLLLLSVASAHGSLADYDRVISEDASGGFVPLARLAQQGILSGANRLAFNFGTNSGNATFEFLVEGNPTPSTSAYLAVGSNISSSLRFENSNSGYLGFTQLGVRDYLFSPAVPCPTAATHVVYLWNASTRTMKLYRNGVLVGVCSGVDGAFAMPEGQGWLGANPNNTENMTGVIYRVTVYDGLEAEEVIQAHSDAFNGVIRPPVIVSFVAAPAVVFRPGSATLKWDVRNAESIFVDGRNVTSFTNITVTPTTNTTYTLAAANSAGSVTQQVSILVDPAPRLIAFQTSRAYLAPGESTSISWNVLYAQSISISPAIGDVTAVTVSGTGSTNVSPDATTTYTLSATNAFGAAGAQVHVYRINPANHPVITEFMADDRSWVADEDGEHSGWIEIHNPLATALNLKGFFLTDDRGNPTKWAFPPMNIEAGTYMLVFASGKDRTNAFAPLHTNFRLSNAGEYLALIGPGPSVLHAFDPAYPSQQGDVSYGLMGSDVSLPLYFAVPTPGGANVESPPPPTAPQFSMPGGTFLVPFLLSLGAEAGADIYYSLDGSTPTSLEGRRYETPVLITNTTQIRAVAVVNGRTSRVSGTSFVRLAPALASYTSSLPIMVIENFGAGIIPQKGWNSTGAGIKQVLRQPATWMTFERTPSGGSALTDAPQMLTPVGIRGRGAFSTQWRQKPYSVEAIDEAGAEAKVSPLGMPAHADWVLYFPDPDQNKDPALLFNTFAYELSKTMGNYAVRFRWVEAFINEDGGELSLADRRGIYAIIERVSRGKDRLDFEKLSFDGTSGGWLLNINRMDPEPDSGWPAPNGATRPWFFHTAGANRLVETAADTAYSTVPGDDQPQQWNAFINFDNPNGYSINKAQRTAIETWFRQFEDALYNNSIWQNPTNGYRRYIDQRDFIDYFVMNVLTRSGDGLLISMFPWKGDDGKLRMGPAWDYNWSSYYVSGGPTGVLMHRSDRLWYQRLFTDPDFLQAYIDRWCELRRGPLSNAAMQSIIDRQAAEIGFEKSLYNGMPSVAEWTNRLGQLKNWLTQRADWIDTNYLRAPVFNQNGGAVPDGFAVIITGTNGTIYYTTDGTDPRASGGLPSASARTYSTPITLRAPTPVQARLKNGSSWSGLTSAFFSTPQDLSELVITEIMYNPAAFGGWSSDDLEFIELQNIGTNTLNLGGLSFTSGISFSFPAGTQIGPGEYFVLGRNAAALQARYPGLVVRGIYTGRLDNGGETIQLSTSNLGTLFDFSYGDRAPWPLSADGYGFSVVPRDLAGCQNSGDGSHWRASSVMGGSPGGADPAYAGPRVVINEVFSGSVPPGSDSVELLNLGETEANIGGWFLSDDGSAPRKFRIPDPTRVPPGGYVLFTESDFNPLPGTALNFALNSSGDALYLAAADAAGSLSGYGHGLDFGAAAPGVSFGRYVNSVGQEQFPPQVARTPGTANAGPAIGPMVFTEIMYAPRVGGDEFVELRNITAGEIRLFDPEHPTNTWQIGGLGYAFPTNFVLPPEGLLLVVATNPPDFRAKYGVPPNVPVLGPAGGFLQNGGERLQLERPGQPEANGGVPYIVVEAVRYEQNAPWPGSAAGGGASLQRVLLSDYGDDARNWIGADPNPGYFFVTSSPPLIVQPPLNQSVVRGASFTLSVAVSDTSSVPLSYFWMQNGEKLSNGVFHLDQPRCFLTVANAQPMYTNYTLLVSNVAGFANTFACPAAISFITDTDGDGLPDPWETEFGLATNDVTDAALDSDGDGMDNLHEYFAGTNPRDSHSILRIDSIAAGLGATLEFYAHANRTYTVQAKSNVQGGTWTNVAEVVASAVDRIVRVQDRQYTTNRFYRVATPQNW